MPLRNLQTITLFVEDLGAARQFYGAVFDGRELFSDDVSTALSIGNVVVNLLQADQAGELVEPGVVGAPGPARCLLTVEVQDVDAVCADLADLGVPLRNGPQDRPWGVRTAAFADPAGHLWEIAAPLPG
ncbi:Predicted lactoylglutathione lyase [Klenkia marina]|uniref:Predicted lactoylglutathione lyase n=1 Tax=Klenkia marina TaxID=1960309 RepID=A0A1G4YSH6_9ACTN|nr:VOC family protein [Klenkia marina]SCX56341.1 Predicted lactoylglutathione lyase [Klenkia marina]